MKYCLILIAIIFYSCEENDLRHYVGLPSMMENQIPSQYLELPFNVSIEKNNLPNKIKRIYQVKNIDTLNILEYDNQKNLIFKYYKQYVGSYWHDKFVYMVEANVYKKNKLVKTYYLHSNVGYKLFTYDYLGENLCEVKCSELDNIKGVNSNQYSIIKKIKNYQDCITFIKLSDIDKKTKEVYVRKREFNGDEVKTIDNDDGSSYNLFKFNKKNQVEKIEYYLKNKKWETNSKFYKYDNLGRVINSYSMNKKDTLKTTVYKYVNHNKIIIRNDEGRVTKKEYYKNNLIKDYFKDKEYSYHTERNYELDKYGIPIKEIDKNSDKVTVFYFKNYYEFYK